MNKDKGAGIVPAVIDAAREAVQSIQLTCDNCGNCKNCDDRKSCAFGMLDSAIRKYDKMAKREADRIKELEKNIAQQWEYMKLKGISSEEMVDEFCEYEATGQWNIKAASGAANFREG